MENNQALEEMVADDLTYCTAVWEKYSHDKEHLEVIYNRLLSHYTGVIEKFSQGMKVLSGFETTIDTAEIYRYNITLLYRRLQRFRENGYENPSFSNRIGQENLQDVLTDIPRIRMELGVLQGLNKRELQEGLRVLDELEELFSKDLVQEELWDALRPYVMWVSGKSCSLAMWIIPIFLKVKYRM